MLKDKLNYTPQELKFGTSGLRALLTEMTDLECYINTKGFLDFLQMEPGQNVYLAGDLRHSTPRIMRAVAQAISDSGHVAVNCGLIPTPALAYYAGLQQSACIMVTGSHIPDDRNGIKFYKPSGEVLKNDEEDIKESVAIVRESLYNTETENFDADGALTTDTELGQESYEATKAYAKRYEDFFGSDALSGKTIVMYQHSAVGRDMIPDILESLGANVVSVDRSDVFIPIDTENVTPEDEEHFKRIASEYENCDAIVSTDGDSDRPFVIDENGTFYRGDVLGLVVAQHLGADAVAIPISSNDAVTQQLSDDGVECATTKIGSPYVIVQMDEFKSSHETIVGWEVNGGFLTGSDITLNGKTLSALPTRDALLPIVVAILAAVEKKCTVSELFAKLPNRFTQAGLIDNFDNEVSGTIIETLGANDDGARALIEKVFTGESGFGSVGTIDATDGVRITFDNGDVAHLRPSGNAPQLRIYSNADSQARADEIVAMGIREPDGLLRQTEKAVT